MAESMPLNKYLAHAGVGSRRAVIEVIKQGRVTVNEQVANNPAHRVGPHDVVVCDGALVCQEKKAYILLNKLAGYVTTVDDEHKRSTVMDLIAQEYPLRVYPVGRLDRDTTGLLLLTNDGQLAQHLAHPKYEIKKTYHVTLDRVLTSTDEQKLRQGIMLEDGLVVPDNVAILRDGYRRVVSITLHSGKYHVVRRLFEALGYPVVHLDRAVYAGIVKQGLRPGAWRLLNNSEITRLKKLCNL